MAGESIKDGFERRPVSDSIKANLGDVNIEASSLGRICVGCCAAEVVVPGNYRRIFLTLLSVCDGRERSSSG
jgi:hypothetical protein